LTCDPEAERLRALLSLAREYGAKRIALPDGLVIDLLETHAPASGGETHTPASSGGLVLPVPPTGKPNPPDDDEDLEDEAAKEKDLRARWNEHWGRLTLSSGAAIPPFHAERALRLLGPR
jgi:hypothetical protein